MDFVGAEIIVSLGTISYTCLNDKRKGLGIVKSEWFLLISKMI